MAQGALRVVSEGELQQRDAEEARRAVEEEDAKVSDHVTSSLGAHIRRTFDEFKRHRTSENITDQLLSSMRAYNGVYDPKKLQDIKQFGGSEVFARITSVKCRGATALLRDVFLGGGRPWGVEPTPVPSLPDPITEAVSQILQSETSHLQDQGIVVEPQMIESRRGQLLKAAQNAALKTARQEAKKAEDKLDDFLVEGRFYDALVEFLIDLPIFPFAVLKGPVVQNVTDLKWENGKMVTKTFPRMFWYRVSPFDVYFTPGASSIEDTDIIERVRFRRSDLNSLIGVKGYDDEAIRKVLEDYPDGYAEHLDEGDSERAALEQREDPVHDHGWYDSLEFHGNVQGTMLREWGMTEDQIPDPILDYNVTAWLFGRHVIKVQINPNPKKRHNYYITSYEKVPGSLLGNGITAIINDFQEVANSAFRSLVNNMSISSGPQAVINEDRLSPSTNPDSMYPWKRWRTVTDPMATNTSEKAVDFFQPQSNAQELLGVYRQMTEMADEVSAIPRYITGNEKVGGAARTASGLSMLMNNTSKVLQMVAANIDKDVLQPVIDDLYDMVMLTDKSGMFRGDENIIVKGVTLAMQKETDRMRRLEFLQITANPMDSQIITPKHRAVIHRHLAEDLGLPGEDVVPTEEELEMAMAQAAQAQMAAAAQAQGAQAPAPGGAPAQGLGEQTDNMFRTGGV